MTVLRRTRKEALGKFFLVVDVVAQKYEYGRKFSSLLVTEPCDVDFYIADVVFYIVVICKKTGRDTQNIEQLSVHVDGNPATRRGKTHAVCVFSGCAYRQCVVNRTKINVTKIEVNGG